MSTKQERQKVRNELVKMARDQGKLDMGQASTRELIDRCAAAEDPIAAMKQALELPVEIPPPQIAPESSPAPQTAPESDSAPSPPEAKNEALATGGEKSGQLMCCLPLMDETAVGYKAEHIQLRLTPEQKENLARLYHGLRSQHAQMDNGHHVDNAVDAVRWLLEKIPHLHMGSVAG